MKIFRKLFSKHEEKIDEKIDKVKDEAKKEKAKTAAKYGAVGAAGSLFYAKTVKPKAIGKAAENRVVLKKVMKTSEKLADVADKLYKKELAGKATPQEVQARKAALGKCLDFRSIEEFVRNHDKKTMDTAKKQGKVSRAVATGIVLLPAAAATIAGAKAIKKVNQKRDKKIEDLENKKGSKK